MAKKKKIKFDPKWAKAKKVCRLNQDDIRKAKELGFKPKSLLKSNPSSAQPWKMPVKQWIRELHAKRFGKRKSTSSSGGSSIEFHTTDTLPDKQLRKQALEYLRNERNPLESDNFEDGVPLG